MPNDLFSAPLGIVIRSDGDWKPDQTPPYVMNNVVRHKNAWWAAAQKPAPGEEPGISPCWVRWTAPGDLPVLSLIWSLTGSPAHGFLDLSKDNGLLSRAAYPDAWAAIQKAHILATGSVVSDADWLAECAANNGVCGKFSTGDGSNTFRLPLLRKEVSDTWQSGDSTPMMKLYGTVIGASEANVQALVQAMGDKLDRESYRHCTSYSTLETDTGRTWINGKTVYSKTVSTGALPNKAEKLIPHGVSDMDQLITLYGAMVPTSGNMRPLPSVTNTPEWNIDLLADRTYIKLRTAYDHSTWTISYVTIVYTKKQEISPS